MANYRFAPCFAADSKTQRQGRYPNTSCQVQSYPLRARVFLAVQLKGPGLRLAELTTSEARWLARPDRQGGGFCSSGFFGIA